MRSIQLDQLRRFIADSLTRSGLEEPVAAITARHMAYADAKGADTHGIMQLPVYAGRLRDGGINKRPNLAWERETGNTAVLNADNGMGHYVAHLAMERAIELAERGGVSFVTIKNGNHFGAAASYTRMAADAKMIGFITSNAAPLLAAAGGTERVLGNNPFSFSVPRREEAPVILDIACGNVAMGKLTLAHTKGESIPLGWALDKDGAPTTDPLDCLERGGSLVPMGGHKGYGLALMMDILSGVISGSKYGKEVGRIGDTRRPTGVGCSMFVLNVAKLMPLDEFEDRLEDLVSMVVSSRRAPGVENIYLPGQKGSETAAVRAETGVPLPDKLADRLRELAVELGLEAEEYGL